MSSLSEALISFAIIFGGVLFGMLLKSRLPDHHLSSESKDTVKLGAGIVATMAALVLGILVGSAKNSFDASTNGITEIGTKVIMLDRTLSRYGPESKDVRLKVRATVENALQRLWPEQSTGVNPLKITDKSARAEDIQTAIMNLSPQTEAQRRLKERADQIINDIIQLRWMLLENQQKSIPTPLVVVLVFWLTMLFISFGLFAPRNLTVVMTMFVSAMSVSAALFIILEMSTPLEGVIKISSAPLHKAIEHIGK